MTHVGAGNQPAGLVVERSLNQRLAKASCHAAVRLTGKRSRHGVPTLTHERLRLTPASTSRRHENRLRHRPNRPRPMRCRSGIGRGESACTEAAKYPFHIQTVTAGVSADVAKRPRVRLSYKNHDDRNCRHVAKPVDQRNRPLPPLVRQAFCRLRVKRLICTKTKGFLSAQTAFGECRGCYCRGCSGAD